MEKIEKIIQLLREIVWCFTGLVALAMIILWTEGAFANTCFKMLLAAL